MRKINYPLIVSDFDGTLVNDDGTIAKENQDAIASYVAAGGKFAFCTGRLPNGILPRASELGLKGLACCCQGTIIVDIETRKSIFEARLPLESAVLACEKMEEMGLHIHAYEVDGFFANMDDEPLRLYEKLVRHKANLVLDKPLSVFLRECNFAPFKLLAMVEPNRSDAIIERLTKENIEGCALTKSAEFLVEVVNREYSKGTAVAFLAEHYGVPLEKTVAIGDQRNDLPMIERAGVGAAVANADEGLKAKANYVCARTNEEGAVAEIIEKFGFYGETK